MYKQVNEVDIMRKDFKTEIIEVDFCVVGGGLAGMAAAVSAARHGTKVALVQDRPVLGGNSSSEIRMHVCGAHGDNNRETGILEELALDNLYYNRTPSYSVWDAVLYGKTQYQENLTLILNASVNSCEMDGNTITSVKAWQTTTGTWIEIRAKLFADCSGDGILAPLSGADFRMGREGRSEFNESIAPEVADKKTMGMSCLFQAREYPEAQPFTPFPWANSYGEKDIEWLEGRNIDVYSTNFWWMEVGGEVDSILDTERCREELLRIAFGVWDYIKNHSPNKDKYANFALDWQGFLPGKRESRRYYGDVILSQNDIEAEGRFEDLVAYGGWSMDDHFPAGIHHKGPGTIFHPAPSPFGIPYRSLYSRNIANLFCAGRCHSATHSAMSSTRVMATTTLMGQAAGTAAAIAVRDSLQPRGVYEKRLGELQQTLMDDDCWLPWQKRKISDLCTDAKLAASAGDPEMLRNGVDRQREDSANLWQAPIGSHVEYMFDSEVELSSVRIVFDSNLNRKDPSRNNRPQLNMRHVICLDDTPLAPPETLVRSFRIEAMGADGEWRKVSGQAENYQRLVKVPLSCRAKGVRIVPETTWGSPEARIFAFEADVKK
ncbi:MAG: FAD-dependent oxidoreductase [Lentisphaerae bacterium]|nr:FAD-dependent oxidoreductase [Lentisphaerota bacterium]